MTRCPLCHDPLHYGVVTVDLLADVDDTGPHPATMPAHAECWRIVEEHDLLDLDGSIPVQIADMIREVTGERTVADLISASYPDVEIREWSSTDAVADFPGMTLEVEADHFVDPGPEWRATVRLPTVDGREDGIHVDGWGFSWHDALNDLLEQVRTHLHPDLVAGVLAPLYKGGGK